MRKETSVMDECRMGVKPLDQLRTGFPPATVVVSMVFQVVLHCCHEVLPHSSRVCVDKLCIHPVDDEIKLQGVAHLGLSLFFSSTTGDSLHSLDHPGP